MEEIVITTTANGYIVNVYAAGHKMGMATHGENCFVFETMESLQLWMDKNMTHKKNK